MCSGGLLCVFVYSDSASVRSVRLDFDLTPLPRTLTRTSVTHPPPEDPKVLHWQCHMSRPTLGHTGLIEVRFLYARSSSVRQVGGTLSEDPRLSDGPSLTPPYLVGLFRTWVARRHGRKWKRGSEGRLDLLLAPSRPGPVPTSPVVASL